MNGGPGAEHILSNPTMTQFFNAYVQHLIHDN